MTSTSRWSRIKEGMTFDEVKKIFGNDMWQSKGFGDNAWLVNNEADSSPDHGYIVTFDKAMLVVSKGAISLG